MINGTASSLTIIILFASTRRSLATCDGEKNGDISAETSPSYFYYSSCLFLTQSSSPVTLRVSREFYKIHNSYHHLLPSLFRSLFRPSRSISLPRFLLPSTYRLSVGFSLAALACRPYPLTQSWGTHSPSRSLLSEIQLVSCWSVNSTGPRSQGRTIGPAKVL